MLWHELVEAWELSPAQHEEIDRREGTACATCRSSIRMRQLASVIVAEMNGQLGTGFKSLSSLCRSQQAALLHVAEINAAGALHKFLSSLRGLHYSEYGSTDPAVRSEDLMSLSYPDCAFDLVITSETLEHVPDFDRALREIRRVLKPGGMHIFTIPVISSRATRSRASIVEGEVIHSLPPSYHGAPNKGGEDLLVFHEFGGDVVIAIEAAGFTVRTVTDKKNSSLITFVTSPAD